MTGEYGIIATIVAIAIILLFGLHIVFTFSWPAQIVGVAMVGGAIVGFIALGKNS